MVPLLLLLLCPYFLIVLVYGYWFCCIRESITTAVSIAISLVVVVVVVAAVNMVIFAASQLDINCFKLLSINQSISRSINRSLHNRIADRFPYSISLATADPSPPSLLSTKAPLERVICQNLPGARTLHQQDQLDVGSPGQGGEIKK